MPTDDPTTQVAQAGRPRSLKRWLIVAVVVALLGVSLLPTILLQTPVRNWLLDSALSPVGLRAEIGSAQWGWLVPASLRQVNLRTQDHEPLIDAETITTDRSLMGMLFSGGDLGQIQVDQPKIHLIVSEDGTNFDFPPAEDAPASGGREQQLGPDGRLGISVRDAALLLKTITMPQETTLFAGVDLEAELRHTSGEKLLLLEPAKLLDRAEISPEICDAGLKFVLPILAEATSVSGEMSLGVSACRIDLASPEESQVAGVLDVHAVRARLKNPLISQIMQLLSKPGGDAADASIRFIESQVSFRIDEKRVWHDGLAFGLPDIAPDMKIRSAGSVGFDESLEITLEVPLPLKLLGGSNALARSLGDQTIRIPVSGTLSKPEVQLESEDLLGGLISEFSQQITEGNSPLDGIFKQLRERRSARDDEGAPSLRELIRQRIRDRGNEDIGAGNDSNREE